MACRPGTTFACNPCTHSTSLFALPPRPLLSPFSALVPPPTLHSNAWPPSRCRLLRPPQAVLPSVEKALNDCTFFAIDCEMTGEHSLGIVEGWRMRLPVGSWLAS